MKNKDFDQFDPDWQMAKKHAKATKAGFSKQQSADTQRNLQEVCQCCGHAIQKQPIDLWTHTNQLHILGFGFPLFYEFLKYCIILLIINIGVYNAFSMYNAIQNNKSFCHPQKSNTHLPHLSSDEPQLPHLQPNHSLQLNSTVANNNNQSISQQKTANQIIHHKQNTTHPQNDTVHAKDHKQSHTDSHNNNHQGGHKQQHKDNKPHLNCYTFMTQIAHIEQTQNDIELILRCISFAINVLLLLYIRNNITKIEGYFDQRTTTLSDYSAIISGINIKENVRTNIINFFTVQLKGNSLDLVQVILLPHIEEIEEIQSKKMKILNTLRPYYQQDKLEDQNFIQLNKQLESTKKNLSEEASKYFQLIKKDEIACQYAIVIFETQEEKEKAIEQFRKANREKREEYFGDSSLVFIKQAENEEEIVWENFSISRKKRLGRIILGWSLSILLLGVTFIGFFYALIAKSHGFQQALKEKDEHPGDPVYISKYNGFVALVFVLMFGIVLFDKLILSSLFHKFTHLQLHQTRSNEEFSFGLKYALGLFFTTAIMTLVVEAWQLKNYYSHPYGVVEEETIMFVMNAIFIPVFWLINPFRIAKQIKKSCYKGKKHLTQYQANKILEQDTYFLGKRFAEIIQTMWFVFLYSTLLPVGAMISVVGLGLYYWVDKYNLLRRSKIQGNVSSSFVQTSLLLLDFILILKPIGSIIFDEHLRNKSYELSDIILICIGFLYMVIPKNRIIIFFNKEYFKPEQKTYSQMLWKFKQGYTGKHPFYSLIDPNLVRECKKVKREKEGQKQRQRQRGTNEESNQPVSATSLKRLEDHDNAKLRS